MEVTVFINTKIKLIKKIEIDENTVLHQNFNILQNEILEKVNEINKYYAQKMIELDEIQKKYLDKVKWLITNVTSIQEIIKKTNSKLDEIFMLHFQRLFPKIYDGYENCLLHEIEIYESFYNDF